MRFELEITKILKSGGGDWKRVVCHGNGNCYSCTCVAFRTISLVFCCKLTEISLFIFLIQYLVKCTLHIVHISQTQISLEPLYKIGIFTV